MLDIDKFELEYREFVRDLKIKKFGENYSGYENDLKKIEILKNKTKTKEEKQVVEKHIEEKPKTNQEKILKLRDDIRSGRIVKVKNRNGKFVWKKVN